MTGNKPDHESGRTRKRVVLWFTARRFKALVVSWLFAIAVVAWSSPANAQLSTPDNAATSLAVQTAGVFVHRARNAAESLALPTAADVQRVEAIAMALYAENEVAALTPRVAWLVTARPQSWRARWLEGYLALLRGNAEQAVASASLCLELVPGYGPCHFVRGAASAGLSPDSIADLQAAHLWDPQNNNHAEAYARALLASGDPRTALQVLRSLLQAQSTREVIPLVLLAARAAEESGDTLAAESWYASVAEQHPDPAAGMRYLIQFYQRTGRQTDADALLHDLRRRQGPAQQRPDMRPLR